jgi:alpha-N-arabinofuranosidase
MEGYAILTTLEEWVRRDRPRAVPEGQARLRRTGRNAVRAWLLAVAILGAWAPAVSAAEAPPANEARAATQIIVGPQTTGTISKDIFGANLLWAYDEEGAFDTTTDSFYPAFVASLRRLGITSLRYPGGTASDSFDWLRAVGPDEGRLANEPYGMQYTRISDICCDLDGPAASSVGPDEFGQLLDQSGAIGNIVVNFATGTTQEAADFVAYMTAPLSSHPSSRPADASYWAALRSRNGHPAPYDVPYWEVGNEQFFPGQYGWRSGRVVSVGRHTTPCPAAQVATCLYAFGGTTYFAPQPVGTFADELARASYSAGTADQHFYVYFPPVVPSSVIVYIDGQAWTEVHSVAKVGPRAHVYTVTAINGELSFGNNVHGEIPPKGVEIKASYDSGPHGGFVQFYAAMKAMNPDIHICETEETNSTFLKMMGKTYPYDCVELHEYAKPTDIDASMTRYEEGLMTAPVSEGATLVALQAEIRRYSGKGIPVVMTEYGQLVTPMPKADPEFNLSLDEGLLIGAQLEEWATHGVPLAEKYLLDSVPFLGTYPYIGLSTYSAMLAGPGPNFLVEPTGQVLGLMSRLGGKQLLQSAAVNNPEIGPGINAPDLWVTAAASQKGAVDIVVINASPVRSIRSDIVIEGELHKSQVHSLILDGPSPTAYNTAEKPDNVTTVARTADVGSGDFFWTFPAHSVTMLQLSRQPPELLAAGAGNTGPSPGPADGVPPVSAQISS